MTREPGSQTAAFAPPRWRQTNIHRPRIRDALDRSAQSGHLTVVSAPSGFGKTTAVSDWWEGARGRAAWLLLNTFDADVARRDVRILRAMHALVSGTPAGADLEALDPEDTTAVTAFDAVTAALADAQEQYTLVIDDAHLAGDGVTSGLLGALLDSPPPRLRVVLIGRGSLVPRLARWILGRPEALVNARTLSFTLDEIVDCAERSESGDRRSDATGIMAATRGWPIAVQFSLLARSTPDSGRDSGLLRDYLRDHILGELPADLREFALDTAVCTELTVALACAVSGRSDADVLLRRCVQAGLFIDEYHSGSESRYRWHPLFARLCIEIGAERDAQRRSRARAAAARHLEASDPLAAITYLLDADLPDEAARVVMDRWVRIAVGADAAALERVCGALPVSYHEQPGILLVRACAQDALGAPHIARTLLAQAVHRAKTAPSQDFVDNLSLAQLFLLDARADLVDASERVHARVTDTVGVDRHARATILFLLGWAGMRHRATPVRTVEHLRAAAAEADDLGDRVLAERSRRVLAFVLAWSGQLQASRETLAVLGSSVDDVTPWQIHGGGQAASAAGFIAYWEDDTATAISSFTRVLRAHRSTTSFSGVARVMLILAAARSGDPTAIARASVEHASIPRRDRHGVSWAATRDMGDAVLADAAGRVDEALDIASRYEETGDVPLVVVSLAEIVRRHGDAERALRMLRRLTPYEGVSYVRASVLLTEAVVHRQSGADELAHELCEASLAIGARQGLRRVFAGDVRVAGLLTAHRARGSSHQGFLAEVLGDGDADDTRGALSPREQLVLHHLRTTKTTAEICVALDVSANTLKTHTRSIYRKLGVRSRRELVHPDRTSLSHPIG